MRSSDGGCCDATISGRIWRRERSGGHGRDQRRRDWEGRLWILRAPEPKGRLDAGKEMRECGAGQGIPALPSWTPQRPLIASCGNALKFGSTVETCV